ncbi:VOC family protein [Marinobacter xestospongiae]|uniref:VOC family protein n=1 Tax=Marinobacter xestospongiae TaxID=994319 RepID=UPI002006B687|nr:VOC family protein [Marinobacter xestospongiae]MCK7565477.1 VOC family protein [Marinobacter xestospongiae]
MPQAAYINLPVTDLDRAITFFAKLGFEHNPQFTNDEAAAIVISDHLRVMLHTHESLTRFTRKTIVDAKQATEVLVALQLESREAVDSLFTRAIQAGASEYRDTEDYGFMYGRSFEDLDGHLWEPFWMDPDQKPEG